MAITTYQYIESIEPRFRRHIRPEFVINNQTSNEALFIRLLVGTVQVSNILSGDCFDQFKNYGVLGIPLNQVVSTKVIRECIMPESDLEKLCRFIGGEARTNNAFFENLLEEYSSFFYKSYLGNHTTAFLHLYRSLEYISYSFPLIYATADRNYYGSFNKIKNFFDTSKSELLFFDAFVEKILDQALLDTPLTISFNSLNPDLNTKHYNVVKKYIPDDDISSDVPATSLTFSYKSLLKLTIDLRNRFFHFAIGGKRNIKNSEIVESDFFFGLINDDIANWITIIYFEILKVMCEK